MEFHRSFYNKPFSEIIKMAASRSHTPGGGSVSAMCGIMGATMAEMVANLTVSKAGYEGVSGELTDLIAALEKGIEEMKILTMEDMDAFDRLLKAYRLPKTTDKEKEERLKEIQRATILAATVPLNIALKSVEILKINRRLADIGNISVLSDSVVSSVLLDAAVRGAVVSVDQNSGCIKDPSVKSDVEGKRRSVVDESQKIMEETIAVVYAKELKL
ncbi:MAG: cyclodeaminase/cyclohydrolase family protein [Deltaproteobacteria bacterium]|jgi:formiminotetrahydrofolate cyclodeaminase|nr:cyclodeaminase/cyclohydrolase family protein [Deltaproteobacteria bacterium]